MAVIDIHAHIAPQQFLELLRNEGARLGMTVQATDRGPRLAAGDWTGAYMHPGLVDREARSAFRRSQGIDLQVVSPWIDLTGYDVDPELGAAYCSALNEHMAREAATDAEHQVALGSVPLQSGGETAAEVLREGMLEFGLAGVQIATRVPGFELSDQELRPFWEEAERLGAIVLMHPHHTSQLRPSALPLLEFAVANPADTTLAVAQLIFSDTLIQHPDLTLCLCHGGGFLPWQAGRMDAAWAMLDPTTRTAEAPSIQLRRLWYDSIIHGAPALDFLADRVGADRILLGTDYPFALGDLEPLRSLGDSSLAEGSTLARVTRENATALLERARIAR